MSKLIYNYNLFVNKKEQLKKISRRRSRNRRIKIMLGLVLLLFVAMVVYLINNSTSDYYTYQNEEMTADSGDVRYEEFAGGYLKYSENGIEYQRHFGTAVWNYPLSSVSPFLGIADNYALLGEKGGNHLMLFDNNGLVRELNLSYPLLEAKVSRRGFMEVIMEGKQGNYIQVYDVEGNLIADMRSSIGETGYPVTAAISPDGTTLAVSYYTIKGMHAETNVVFYNLARQLQNKEDDLMAVQGGFVYDNLIIPKLSFVEKDRLLAYGDGELIFFNTVQEPKEAKKVKLPGTLLSVFEGRGMIGCILDNETEPEEGKYTLKMYSSGGSETLSRNMDMNYDKIRVWDKQIIAFHDNECTILNARGNILFQGELEGDNIEEIIPMNGFRTYKVIFANKTVDMKLKFWETSTASGQS